MIDDILDKLARFAEDDHAVQHNAAAAELAELLTGGAA